MAEMKFYFCEACGKRLTEKDIEGGGAKNKKLKGVFCTECAVGVTTMETVPLSNKQAKEILQESGDDTPVRKSAGRQLPGRRSTGAIRVDGLRSAGPRAPSARLSTPSEKGTPIGILAAVGVGVVAVLAGVMFLKSSPSAPPPKRTGTAHKRPERKPETTPIPKARRISSTRTATPPVNEKTPEVPPPQEKKLDTVPMPEPAPDPEQVAREAFAAIQGGPKDLGTRIKKLEQFLEEHGQSIAALQAKRLLKKLKDEQELAGAVAKGGEFAFQYGVSPSPDYRDMQDTSLFGKGGSKSTIYSYQSSEPLAIRFGLGQLPKDARILKATLMLHPVRFKYANPGAHTSVYRLTEAWNELEADKKFCRNGVPWKSHGGTIDKTTGVVARRRMIDDQKQLILKDGWATFNITSLVQAWVSGRFKNYGFTFRNTSDFIITWHSKEAAEANKRPKLVIVLGDPASVPAGTGGVAASKVETQAQKKVTAAEARLMAALDAFETTLQTTGVNTAVKSARETLPPQEAARYEKEWEALVPVGSVALKRISKTKAAWQALVDGKPRAIRTRKGSITGVVKRVTEDELRVAIQGKINNQTIEYTKDVKRTDITSECLAKLVKVTPPDSPDGWIAETILACMDSDPTRAAKALAAAGMHPLAELYTRRVALTQRRVREAEARVEWTRLEAEGRKKLTQTQAKKLLSEFDVYKTAYASTAFHHENEKAFKMLRGKVNDIALDMKARIMKLFHGEVREYDLETRRITVHYDFKNKKQKNDIAAPWEAHTKYYRVQLRKGYVSTTYGNPLNVQFRFYQFDPRDVSVKMSYRNGHDASGQRCYSMGLGIPGKTKPQSNIFSFAGRSFTSNAGHGKKKPPTGKSAPEKATLELACTAGKLVAKIDGKTVAQRAALVKNPPPGIWIGGGWDSRHEITSITISGRLDDAWLKRALKKAAEKKPKP